MAKMPNSTGISGTARTPDSAKMPSNAGRSRLYLAGPETGSELFRWVDDRHGDAQLVQAWRHVPGAASLQGAIYLGRVVKLEPSLNAAFVEIGLDRPGMLPLKKQGNPNEGDSIAVQVRRDAREEKGVRLSASLQTTVDIAPLRQGKAAPCCLLPAPEIWQSLLLALPPQSVEQMTCARRVDAERIAAWCELHLPDLAGRVDYQAARDWTPSRAEALEEIAEALDEEVTLPGGGTLLIEPVRTLTAIDVNSANATGRSGIEQTALSVNLDAAREVPRQLALRNLGGIVVVDFIDLQNRNKRDQVIEMLREAVGIDPAIDWVGNMSRLGLVEILRKRMGASLAEMWGDVVNGRAGANHAD